MAAAFAQLPLARASDKSVGEAGSFPGTLTASPTVGTEHRYLFHEMGTICGCSKRAADSAS